MMCLICGTPIKTPLEPMEYDDYLCNRCSCDDTLVIEIENRERNCDHIVTALIKCVCCGWEGRDTELIMPFSDSTASCPSCFCDDFIDFDGNCAILGGETDA